MIDWHEFHTLQAKGYRNVAGEYRKTAEAILTTDAGFAQFCFERANANEMFALQEDADAKRIKEQA